MKVRSFETAAALLSLVAGLGMLLAVASCSPSGSGGGPPSTSRKTIQNTGSDTMVNVAQAWAEAYHKVQPDVSVEVSGGGSGGGIKDLIQGTVDIANCSREMKEGEIAQARANTGKDPKQTVIGYDGLAVYIHRDNPLEEITIEQLAGIYGKNGAITKWSQLGVDAAKFCSSDEIIRFSRQSNSGTYETFRHVLLGSEDFKLGSRDLLGSKDVVEAISSTPCGIGYSGMGYKTEGVKFLKVAKSDGVPCFLPTPANILSAKYPISRPLFVYTLGEPTGIVKDYIDWILSPSGQAVVKDNGYVPLTDAGN